VCNVLAETEGVVDLSEGLPSCYSLVTQREPSAQALRPPIITGGLNRVESLLVTTVAIRHDENGDRADDRSISVITKGRGGMAA
jgi:hypothetical protein